MNIPRREIALLVFNVCTLAAFSMYFISAGNHEFICYAGVVLFFLAVVAGTHLRVHYTFGSLLGLTVWALLHLSGGTFTIGEVRLYEVIPLRLSSTYPILRYDQIVHTWGFGVATYVMFQVLRPILRPDLKRWSALTVIVVMAGLGVGALNEIAEFMVTIAIPENGVGGYVNTGLDLVSNMIGAVLAMACIRWKYKSAGIPGS